MSRIIVLALALTVIAGCGQPAPKHAVTYRGTPHDVVTVTGQWKMGTFVIGHRIVTDNYVITTDGGGLIGQEGSAFGGPGMVDNATVMTFGQVADVARGIVNADSMTFYGDLTDYTFEGKPVMLLYQASFHGQLFEVNRRPEDN